MQKTIKKELSFSLDTLERYRAKYGRSASLDTNGQLTEQLPREMTAVAPTVVFSPPPAPLPSLFTKNKSPPKMTKLQELQQKKEAYLRAREHEKEMAQLTEKQQAMNGSARSSSDVATASTPSTASTAHKSSESAANTSTTTKTTSTTNSQSTTSLVASKCSGCYTNWSNNHTSLSSQPWCAISDLMYFCDKYEFKTLSTRDLRTHQEIVAEVRSLLSGKAPFDQRTRFPGNIHDPENLWVCIGRCASVEYHLQRIISVFRKPLNQLTPDKQRAVRQNFHLAVSELRLDISARISEVRLYDRLVFEREFRLEWQDEA
ncbi:uncharacterized protein LOC115631303 [Scaptodrosophila lebanonensis]|uniref:Uncharacterized protein LOC115631303 n=1 Tax=Drosophila lebanonensis TaxID=7225 RepID=A0A6J2U8K6_DROLE|nr:uncharacterized protein LOC115631303 [Scaptodrosophila lebanonensis]